jgi:hypothetical protein
MMAMIISTEKIKTLGLNTQCIVRHLTMSWFI